MRLIFLTIGLPININVHGLYIDLLRCFRDRGHDVYVVCQSERREKGRTCLETVAGIKILRVKTGNITKTNLIEKGFSTVTLGYEYRRAIDRYLSHISFDLVLYSTPPVTVASVVRQLKRRDNAFAYLLLKDIFPQSAVDLGVLSKKGAKGLIYLYFRWREHQLYSCSDKIGCMSPANARYIFRHNRDIRRSKLEICPNTIDDIPFMEIDKIFFRQQFGLPENKLIFIYGGNFGKPQDISFILQILEKTQKFEQVYFVMCGSGTEFHLIKEYKERSNAENLTVIDGLPYNEYLNLLKAGDVALIFLNHRFTVPNIPSRLLDYMNLGLPVLAATDVHSDVGKMITRQNFGWWCESNDSDKYVEIVKDILDQISELPQKGENGKKYLLKHFTTEKAYEKIVCAYETWRKDRNNFQG